MKNFAKIKQSVVDFDLRATISRALVLSNRPFWCAFTAAFVALSLIFLYHGLNFMFGDHDWKYFKDNVPLNSGLFEGRFAQFILINLLTGGKLLPILNNTFGFAGFSLGIALLAHYWRLPHKTPVYVMFALFTAVTPYILSFMYFAFLVIPCLSWNAVIIAALILSEKETRHTIYLSLPAILLFTTALGGYPPVINLIATALAGRIVLAVLYESATWRALVKTYAFTVINILCAVILYKGALSMLAARGYLNTAYYNLQTTPLSEWGTKFLLVSTDLIKQFTVTLPFITASYKTAALVLTLAGLTAATYLIIWRRNTGKVPAFIALTGLLYAPLITLFISTSLAETEFSPRIDFFGLLYFYAAMLAITLKSPCRIFKNLAAVCAVCAVCTATSALFEAQKVWKLGFETEMNLYKRISKRFEQNPDFDFNKTYIMVQDTSPAFRRRFYHTTYTHESDDLLNISYVPGLNSGVMWNYKAIKEYAGETAYVYIFRPDAEALNFLQTARPWPAENSVAVGNNWIMTILSPHGLERLRHNYHIPRP